MGLLRPATTTIRFAKIGFVGLEKSGKTFTAGRLAAGIAKRAGGSRPVGFFDTNGEAGYLKPIFDRLKIGFEIASSRSFSDLVTVAHEAEASCSALIVDSITDPWEELKDSYLNKLNADLQRANKPRLQKLQFHHWHYVKGLWRSQFTNWYVNAQVHVLTVGRLGWEYGFQEDAETGRKELVKGDIKIKTEAEFGYIPSLLLEMERHYDEQGLLKHKCIVLGDRFDRLTGQTFIDPTFESFNPFWESLQLGKEAGAQGPLVDTSRTSEDMLEMPDVETDDRRLQRRILNEEIAGLLASALPGQTAREKKLRSDLLQAACGTRSESKMEVMKPAELQQAKGTLTYLLFCLTKATDSQEAIPEGPDFLPWCERQKESLRASPGPNGQPQETL